MKDYTDIQRLFKEDETLKKLYKQQESLQEKIKQRKIRVAQDKQIVTECLEGLTCDDHNKHLSISGVIAGSEMLIAWKGYKTSKKEFNTYACSDGTEKIEAFDCPYCGIVLGTYHVEPYKLKSKSLRQQGAKAGYFIKCSVCDTLIGAGAKGAFGEIKLTGKTA